MITKTIKHENLTNTSKHVFILVDVSGSMSDSMSELKRNLKNSVSTLPVGDKLTIIYYSGNGQCGILIDAFEFNGLVSLLAIHSAIDNLNTIGLTGYVSPLSLLESLLEKDENKDYIKSVIFMSDGHENQNSHDKVINLVKEVSDKIDNGIVVEYGAYANHKMLVDISEKFGAFLYANDVLSFSNIIDKEFTSRYATKNYENSPKKDIAGYVLNGNVYTASYNKKNDAYEVPIGAKFFAFDVDECFDFDFSTIDTDLAIAIGYLAALNGHKAITNTILVQIKSVYLLELFGLAVTKQGINNYLAESIKCISETSLAYQKGNDVSSYKEKDFSIFDVLNYLSLDGNYILPLVDDFVANYKNISAKKVQTTSVLTEDDIENIRKYSTNLTEVRKILDAKYSIKYNYITPKSKGLPFTISYNTERANINFLVRYDVKVDLSTYKGNYPDGFDSNIKEIDTFIHREYSIIKDYVLNTGKLFFSKLNSEAENFLDSKGLLDRQDNYFVVNLENCPIINLSTYRMFETKSAKDKVIQNSLDLLLFKFEQKAFNYVFNSKIPVDKSSRLKELYGESFAEWLTSIGITDSNGFAPKTVKASVSDVYVATKLDVKFKGFSSLPSLNDALTAVSKGKNITPRIQLFLDFYNKFETFSNDELINYKKELKNKKDTLEMMMSKSLFVFILATMDVTGSGLVEHNGKEYEYELDLSDISVEI